MTNTELEEKIIDDFLNAVACFVEEDFTEEHYTVAADFADGQMKCITTLAERKVREASKYQTHIYKIRTLSNGQDVWGIRIACQGKQIYGDIADSEIKAEEKLSIELATLKEKN